jgi:hypothetical protein
MQVVEVFAVLDGLVPAARAVLVLGDGVLGVGGGAAHRDSFSCDQMRATSSAQDGRRLLAVNPAHPRPDGTQSTTIMRVLQ